MFLWMIMCNMNVMAVRKATRPAYYDIGIMYPIADETLSVPNEMGVIYGNIMLMAIDEINNKTDGVYDFLLPETELRVVAYQPIDTFASGAIGADMMATMDDQSGVLGVVGPTTRSTLSGEF